jgi:hypothetical protein
MQLSNRLNLHTSGNFIYPPFVIICKENIMKKTITLYLLMILALYACAPRETPPPAIEPDVSEEVQMPGAVPPAETNPSIDRERYANDAFGLSFQYPPDWFVLDYVSGDTIRVEVGSDIVYPYGTDPAERINQLANSYHIVIQYTKSDQTPYWEEDATYRSLLALKDGESLSDARSQLVRVRQLDLGRFKGFEYITTLSETGQTDPFYLRSVMLFDEQTNDLITVMGQPYNVAVGDGLAWRAVYRSIDEANLGFYHDIVASITLE